MLGATVYLLALLAAPVCGPETKEASALLEAHQAERAIDILERAAGKCPAAPHVFDLLGIAHDLLGSREKAQSSFRRAVELEPRAARSRINLAVSLFRSGREQDAIGELEQAVGIEPANRVANANLGSYYAQTGEWDRALKYFEAAGAERSPEIRADPQFRMGLIEALLAARLTDRALGLLPSRQEIAPLPLRCALGLKLAERGLYASAVEQFSSVPEAARDEAVWFNLGLAHSRLGQFEVARRCYFAAIDHNPANVDAYFRVALDFAEQGDGLRAIPWFWRARRMAPGRVDVAAALAEQLIAARYLESAAGLLITAGDARDPLLELARADLAREQKRLPEASEHYRRALQLNAELGPACAGLARVLALQNQPGEAVDLLERFVGSHPNDAAANAELGRIELDRGNWRRALPMLELAWKGGRSDLQVGLSLARCYRQAGRAGKVIDLLGGLRGQLAGDRRYHYELAQAYTSLKKNVEAESELAQLRLIDARTHEGLRFAPPAIYIH
jgi:tetratricopeptide (TPR) repeat protein